MKIWQAIWADREDRRGPVPDLETRVLSRSFKTLEKSKGADDLDLFQKSPCTEEWKALKCPGANRSIHPLFIPACMLPAYAVGTKECDATGMKCLLEKSHIEWHCFQGVTAGPPPDLLMLTFACQMPTSYPIMYQPLYFPFTNVLAQHSSPLHISNPGNKKEEQ